MISTEQNQALLTVSRAAAHHPAWADYAAYCRVALQFRQPSCVCFLYRGEEATDFAWVEQLRKDELPPQTCSHDGVGFGNEARLRTLLALATQQHPIYGYPPTDDAFLREPYRLVCWCGDYGVALAAPQLWVMTHEGEQSLDQIAEANRQWWDYWRTYWAKRFTAEELPYDYACEVTIPLQDDTTAPDEPN